MTTGSGDAWSSVWRSAIADAFGHGTELEAGDRLARRAELAHPEMAPGSMILRDPRGAWVAQLGIRQLDDDQWGTLLRAVAADPRSTADVITGDLPIELHRQLVALGCSLIPEKRDLGADCSCNDWREPCRHIGALVSVVADLLIADPWLLTMLRGRTRDQIVQRVRSHRAGGPDVDPAPSLDTTRGVDLGVAAMSALQRDAEPLPPPLAGLRQPGDPVAFRSPPADAGVEMVDLHRLVADAAGRAFLLLAGAADADALLIDPADDQHRIELSRRPLHP